jgi:Calcineurin-like phosphoesterase
MTKRNSADLCRLTFGLGLAFMLLCCTSITLGQVDGREREKKGPKESAQSDSRGPAHLMAPFAANPVFDVVLGRVEERSITVSLLAYQSDMSVQLRYGVSGTALTNQSAMTLRRATPTHWLLKNLLPDTAYEYQVLASDGVPLANGHFHTARPSGNSFTVTVTADSHLDQNTSVPLYRQTLANALKDGSDFHIDLGDTFMTEKHADRTGAAQQYLAQRSYFGEVAHSMPLFLALGNHDGEEVRHLRGGADSLAVWANAQRKNYFANPVPDSFFSGNTTADPLAGELQDYYAWTWGDALFMVLDPYWHAPTRRSDERWNLSLGLAQYQWLQSTLAASKARYKLVFVHQLVGGSDRQGRGGIEAVPFGEWGGSNADGSPGMAEHRPGFSEPIHALLKRHGVTAVFHGHDHLFAAQSIDGIAYQEVPQPGHPASIYARMAVEYGYLQGVVRGDSGHLRIRVEPQQLRVDFIGSELDRNGKATGNNGRLLHSYVLQPR